MTKHYPPPQRCTSFEGVEVRRFVQYVYTRILQIICSALRPLVVVRVSTSQYNRLNIPFVLLVRPLAPYYTYTYITFIIKLYMKWLLKCTLIYAECYDTVRKQWCTL